MIIERELSFYYNIKNNLEKKYKFRQGDHLIHILSEYGYLSCLKMVIKKKKYVNQLNYHLQTPIFHACENSNYDCIKLLLKNRALINIEDGFNQNLFHILAKNNDNIKILDLLFEYGMNPEKLYDFNYYGETPLHIMVRFDNVEMLESIIDRNIDIYTFNEYGHNLMHEAANYDSTDCIKELAKVNRYLIDSYTSHVKETPLHICCINGSIDSIKLLLKLGANMNVYNYNLLYPWKLLENQNYVKYFYDNNGKVNDKNLLKDVRTLKYICRKFIRQKLIDMHGYIIHDKIKELNITRDMKDYLDIIFF